ncbi:MAG: helix-turn-helix domain-containing protein [Firmicutes bacterium]|nr:helix-turn-helix domain-containing protein [Bacillota bacterium]
MRAYDKGIGDSIKNARKAANFAQQQLAKLIGTSHAAISFWENNINVPNVLDCWKIADVLGISIDELVGRE